MRGFLPSPFKFAAFFGLFTSSMLTVLFAIFFSSSSEGIPGVGVAPFGRGFPKSSGAGMPGVGVVPFGGLFIFLGSGIPGVGVPPGVIRLAENSGGRFAGAFTLAELEFAEGVEEQAMLATKARQIVIINKFFNI